MNSRNIHHEITFEVSPDRIYEALLNSDQFSKLSGVRANISRDVGGSFSCFGGYISGLNVELVPNKRIVQAWRSKDWNDGIYSIVKFELNAQGSDTRLIFDHSGSQKTRKNISKADGRKITGNL